jgi:pimeloyl-ACP methyl ester carboxylesterase
MPKAAVGTGMELEYETFGSPSDPTLLLVGGYTSQLIWWPVDFCESLVERGLHVVRFDNRDAGLSTKFDGVSVDTGSVVASALAEEPLPAVPYTLSDLAADAVALLDHLGVAAAHIVGVSMGGMIVQMMAIEHPGRVRSLCSIMSNSGEPEFGQSTPDAMEALLEPYATERSAYIAAAPRDLAFSSKRYGDADELKAYAERAFDRGFYPEGAPRQLAAIYASGRRTEGLKALRVPALVIHGRDDTLITPSGGARTAELIEGADYFLIGDMGHDLPTPLLPKFVDLIAGHISRAESAR